jgi:hypothetical protein
MQDNRAMFTYRLAQPTLPRLVRLLCIQTIGENESNQNNQYIETLQRSVDIATKV